MCGAAYITYTGAFYSRDCLIQGAKSPSSASQAILCIFWNPRVHCQMHESPLLVLKSINRVCAPSSISWRSCCLCLGLPSGLCHIGFPPELCTSSLPYTYHMPGQSPWFSNPSSISFQSRYILYIVVVQSYKILNIFLTHLHRTWILALCIINCDVVNLDTWAFCIDKYKHMLNIHHSK